MTAMEEAAQFFEKDEREFLISHADAMEIRIRAGSKMRLRLKEGEACFGGIYTQERLEGLISNMLLHSAYAKEDELGQGYFTLPSGSRVGVAGVFKREGEKDALVSAGSVLIRLYHEARGCAERAIGEITENGRVLSALIVSPPGFGKTTMLRDIARLLSENGWNVAIADERREIAACGKGVPGMDVGERTDVAEGLSKRELLMRLVKNLSPDVVLTDEIGAADDAEAVHEAARMGVAVIASAHAGSLADALARPILRGMLMDGAFQRVITLGERAGNITGVARRSAEEGVWRLG